MQLRKLITPTVSECLYISHTFIVTVNECLYTNDPGCDKLKINSDGADFSFASNQIRVDLISHYRKSKQILYLIGLCEYIKNIHDVVMFFSMTMLYE